MVNSLPTNLDNLRAEGAGGVLLQRSSEAHQARAMETLYSYFSMLGKRRGQAQSPEVSEDEVQELEGCSERRREASRQSGIRRQREGSRDSGHTHAGTRACPMRPHEHVLVSAPCHHNACLPAISGARVFEKTLKRQQGLMV